MRAVQYREFGDASVLSLDEVDRPVPGEGQVLVQVAAGSFNPVDSTMRAGHLQQFFPVTFPHIPGMDVAGTVAELGAGVRGFAVGDPVIGFLPMTGNGSAAEFVLAPAGILAAAPKSIPLTDAAAVPVGALTAWQALFELGELKAGQRVLINGAGGGVGGFAVQFAARAGATVIATAGPRSADAVKAQGAGRIVDYTVTSVTAAGLAPLDVVLNLVPVSEAEAAGLVGLVAPGGVLVSTTGPVDGDPARDVRTAYVQVRSDAAELAGIVARIDTGELTVDVSARYPLADVAAVHERSDDGGLRGKVLIIP